MPQETLRTIQRLTSKEIYMLRYAIDELVKGVEKGGFVIWDGGSIHGTGVAEYARRNALQRVARNLRGARAFGLSQRDSRGQECFTSSISIIWIIEGRHKYGDRGGLYFVR